MMVSKIQWYNSVKHNKWYGDIDGERVGQICWHTIKKGTFLFWKQSPGVCLLKPHLTKVNRKMAMVLKGGKNN